MGSIGLILGKAGAWLLRNPALLMCGVLCASFVMVVVSKNSEISTLNRVSADKDKRITLLVTSLGQARANVAALNSSLETQNASITSLKTQGDVASVKFDQLMAGMAVSNAGIAKKMDTLKTAKPGADICVSAFDLVRSSVQ